MIVVLPTTTGFLVGTIPLKTKKNRLSSLTPRRARNHRKALVAHWAGVRQWLRSTTQQTN